MQPVSCFAPFIIVLSTTLTVLLQSAESAPQVPCYFVFGDSLSDNGNNNNLQTSAKVNYPPYGIDYPGQVPTGRFSNGKNIIDVISEHLGFEESVPSFASIATVDQKMIHIGVNYPPYGIHYPVQIPTGKFSNRPTIVDDVISDEHIGFDEPLASMATMEEKVILKGVNYASGSAGIRSETGQHLGVRIPLDEQLVNHQMVIKRISSMLGNEASSSHLKKCLYMMNIGSNDYLNNYFVPEKYSSSEEYTPEEYAKQLMKEYSEQIHKLYGLGARKVALFGIGELGLIPEAKTKCGSLGIICSTKMSVASTHFNQQLRKLVDELNSKHSDANFTCINMDLIYPTSSIGFVHLTKACCKVRSDGLCEEGNNTSCDNTNHYVFFDNFHPTEAMNTRIGTRAYANFTHLDVHPIDIRTLLHT